MLLYAPEQHGFALELASQLNAASVSTVYGHTKKASWAEAEVLVPILSSQFLLSPECSAAVLWAFQRNVGVVPVLHQAESFKRQLAKLSAMRVEDHPLLPFLCSVLNTSKRVPPNKGEQTAHA